jgi:sirohydrochlorin ferrochelatase
VTRPILIACSHGTSSEAGRAAIREIIAGAQALLPDVRIVPAFVDVEHPQIDEVVATHTPAPSPSSDDDPAGSPLAAVVVPLLLSTGYHTRVDIARAVKAADGRAVVTPPLGTHPLVAQLIVRRLHDAGADADDAVVLSAAGSSDPASAEDVRVVADAVSDLWGAEIAVGFAASAEPLLPEALASAQHTGRRTVAASHVLAPGHFAQVIGRAGFDVVTEPLGPDDALAAVVAARYLAAVSGL